MAYIDPQGVHNPTTGQIIPASWGDAVRDALEYLARNKPHCRVYNSAAISHTTSGTPQALTFNSERFDVGGCHSTSSNTSRLTVPAGEGGKYLIFAAFAFAPNSAGYRQGYFRINGATIVAVDSKPAVNGAGTEFAFSTLYALAAGDYVELVVNQTSGGALNVDGTGSYTPEFGMMWVAV